mmetsp:Transcript_18247/g.58025  ORF Transcript_18247/g.58025 Transcript_18247/m.58025 type:complete len:510 (+) Transcript_18247:153-1682(+)
MSRCKSSLSRTTLSRASREPLKAEKDLSKALKSSRGRACKRCLEMPATSRTPLARISRACWLFSTPSSSCVRSADSRDSSCAAMPSQRSSSARPEAGAGAPGAAAAWLPLVAGAGGAMPVPWMWSSSSAARARVSSLWRPAPRSPTSAARFPETRASFAAGGFAAQRRPRTKGARSASSRRPARRTSEEFAPQSVLVNCASEAASGRSRTPRTIFNASARCAGSALKSPLATRPARSTAPSKEQVGVVDRSNACITRRPWPPGCAKELRAGASHASQRSLATNSWHLGLCDRTASWARPPRTRKVAISEGKRSASRATMTFRALLESSSADSSRSTRPRSRLMTSISRNRARAASRLRAPARSWQTHVRPFGCRHQWLLSGSPLRSSFSPSMRTSTMGGWPRRYMSSLYFGSFSFAKVLSVFIRHLGTATKRPAMTAGLGKFRNFHRASDFSINTSAIPSMAFRSFSSSTLRIATTAASVPSTPFGGSGGRLRLGHSPRRALWSVSKSP